MKLTKDNRKSLGASTELSLVRDGDLDLRFRGWRLGAGEHGTGGNSGYSCDWTRGITVEIYITEGGNLIGHLRRWSKWQGEGGSHDCEVFSGFEELVAWLREDAGGYLGPASKEALEQACGELPSLEDKLYETVS